MYLEYHYLVYCQTYLNHIFFSNTSETLQTLESMRTAPVIQYHLDLMKKCFHLKKSRVRKIDFLFLKRGMPPKNGNICTIPVHVYGIFIQFSLNPGHKKSYVFTDISYICRLFTKYLIVVLIPAIPVRALGIFVRRRLGTISVTPLTQRAYKTWWQAAVTQIQSEGFWEMTWTTCSKICCLIKFLLLVGKQRLSIIFKDKLKINYIQ